jgi:sulfur carrier protein
MRVTINGAERELPEGVTVQEVVAAAGIGHDERGVAVAVDRSVVPRSAWSATAVPAGASVEVLRASAGG